MVGFSLLLELHWQGSATYGQNRVWYISAGNQLEFWILHYVIETRLFLLKKKIQHMTINQKSLFFYKKKDTLAHYLSYATLVKKLPLILLE